MAETGPILVSIEDFREVQNMLHVLRSALETSESELTEAKEANQRLEAALRRCCDENDYCYVCDQHPGSQGRGHGQDCPLVGEGDGGAV